jgi:hypothetical protein
VTVTERTAKINALVALVLATVGAAAWFQPAVAGSDLWWHLASGRDIWASGGLASHDPYSFTAGDAPWLNHEWLWGTIYWAAYSLHTDAVAWLNLALLVLISATGAVLAWRESGSLCAAVAVTWAAAATAHWFFDIRPHLWTLLFVEIVVLTREERWAPWLWPGLVVVWANLHGGFVFGVGTIGLFAVVRTLERSVSARAIELPRREWLGVAGALAATLATPWGVHVLDYPLAYLNSASPFRQILEWHPPEFALDPGLFEGRFWLLALAFAASIPFAIRRDRYTIALAAVSLAMAVTSRRFIPLFAITAAPVIARGLALGLGRLMRPLPWLDAPAARIAAALAAALATLWLWTDVRLMPNLLDRWTMSDRYPSGALRYLEAIHPADRGPLRVLNYYNWGGFLMLHAPQLRVLIDGRANTVYSERVYLDYVNLYSAGRGFAGLLSRYPADIAIAPPGAFSQTLMRQPNPWTLVYADATSRLLIAPGSALLEVPRPDPALVVGDDTSFRVQRARLMSTRRGQVAEAFLEFERIVAKDPLAVFGWGTLMLARATQNDRKGLEQAVSDAREAHPRRSEEIANHASAAYERLGDPVSALYWARRGIPSGPFAQPEAARRRVAKLRRQLE